MVSQYHIPCFIQNKQKMYFIFVFYYIKLTYIVVRDILQSKSEGVRTVEQLAQRILYMLLEYAPERYIREKENGDTILPILLAGSEECLLLILKKLLPQIQRYHPDVLVLTECGKHFLSRLLDMAPALGDFVQVQCERKILTKPKSPMCQLHIQSIQNGSPQQGIHWLKERSYIIVEEGMEEVCKPTEKMEQEKMPCFFATIQTTGQIQIETHGETKKELSVEKQQEYHALLRRLASNLFYVYQRNMRTATTAQEQSHMMEDPYHAEANMEAAVYLLQTLGYCHIHNPNLYQTAQEFSNRIKRKPELIEELACQEQNRWVLGKVLDGYTPFDSLDEIYQSTTVTNRDKKRKKHCFLLPCSANSHLTEEDWEHPDKPRMELDLCDRQSLAVHVKCGQLAAAQKKEIEALLYTIQRCFERNTALYQLANQLRLGVQQLWQGKMSAISLYQKLWQNLWELMKRTQERMETAQCRMEQLREKMVPLLEYVAKNDYKEHNRSSIRMIPFILTRYAPVTVIKLWTDRAWDNLYAVWHLEPAQVHFLAVANNRDEVYQIASEWNDIFYFLSQQLSPPQVGCHILVPANRKKVAQKELERTHCQCCFLHDMREFSKDGCREVVEQMGLTGDYIDVTGADPILTTSVLKWNQSKQLGVFYVRAGQFVNIEHAGALSYTPCNRPLSIQDMFLVSGAQLVSCESATLTELASVYQHLWKVARKIPDWTQFCSAVAKAYKDSKSWAHPCLVEGLVCTRETKKEYRETVSMLAKQGLIQHVKIHGQMISFSFASCEIAECFQKSGTVLERYLYYTALLEGHFDDVAMGFQFSHSRSRSSAQNEIDVICIRGDVSLFISAKLVSRRQLTQSNHLNYILYEISLLAQEFGIHAIPVLAAPSVSQYVVDDGTGELVLSQEVEAAKRRGVILLGHECFEPGILAQVLDAIADGDEKWYRLLKAQHQNTKKHGTLKKKQHK